jgi:hypothetical protein
LGRPQVGTGSDHRLAVGADVDAEIAQLFHLVEQQLVQFQQGMIQGCANADLFCQSGRRQQFLKVGVAETDADLFFRCHVHDLFHLRQLAVFSYQAYAFLFRMTGATPKAV